MKIKVKPKAGYDLYKPNGEVLNKNGEEVTDEKYWRRLARDKCIELKEVK